MWKKIQVVVGIILIAIGYGSLCQAHSYSGTDSVDSAIGIALILFGITLLLKPLLEVFIWIIKEIKNEKAK